ncbi:MAG: AhpC/TSA family protein [Bacteroidales bacterium]|nr:AhpC/TSA family protein [Bacteroidales bacterium]
MKKVFLILALAGLTACSNSRKGFKVTVDVKGGDSTKVADTLYLTNRQAGDDAISDTTVLKNGVAVFRGSIATPQYVMIGSKGNPRMCLLFLENSDIKVSIDLGKHGKGVEISGAPTQKVLDSLKNVSNEMYKAINADSLMALYRDPATPAKVKDEIAAKFDSVETKHEESMSNYAIKNPHSYIALSELVNNVEKISLDSVSGKITEFKAMEKFDGNKNITMLDTIVNILEGLQKGVVAPDFTQNDTSGKPVTFSGIYGKNKITMIDFWASWCSWCRKFNPRLKEIYAQYHSKGFEIVGVSLDSDKSKWKEAIEKDGLKWYQVSDLGYWNNAVAKKYYVRYIPQNIFVDGSGKIIARQVSKDDIENLLKTNLK